MSMVLLMSVLLVFTTSYRVSLSPILIIPGLRGSQLQAMISDGSNCDTLGNWETFWVNYTKSSDCINKVLSLNYNSATHMYSNLPGIQVRVPGFGFTYTVEYIDTNNFYAYFHNMVEYFVTTRNYVRDVTIRAAPFDWRLAPDLLKQQGYYNDVQNLIEVMYTGTGSKVTIVAHSMGGPVSLYFLNSVVSQTWKDKYINAYIPLSGAWSGGNSGLVGFVSNIVLSPVQYLRKFNTSFPTMESAVWLLPNRNVWNNKELIVTTGGKNYTARQYQQMFTDIGRPVDYQRYQDVSYLSGNLSAPNVPVHCFYGVKMSSTPEVLYYGKMFPSSFQNASQGSGDTVVNLKDSEVCLNWKKQQTSSFNAQTFPLNHLQMVMDSSVLKAIDAAINTSNTTLNTPKEIMYYNYYHYVLYNVIQQWIEYIWYYY